MRFDVYFVLILNKIVPIYRCAYVSQVLSQCQAITLLSFLEKWLVVKCKLISLLYIQWFNIDKIQICMYIYDYAKNY